MFKFFRRRKAQKIEAEIKTLQEIYLQAVKSHAPRRHIHKLMVGLRAQQMRLEG